MATNGVAVWVPVPDTHGPEGRMLPQPAQSDGTTPRPAPQSGSGRGSDTCRIGRGGDS